MCFCTKQREDNNGIPHRIFHCVLPFLFSKKPLILHFQTKKAHQSSSAGRIQHEQHFISQTHWRVITRWREKAAMRLQQGLCVESLTLSSYLLFHEKKTKKNKGGSTELDVGRAAAAVWTVQVALLHPGSWPQSAETTGPAESPAVQVLMRVFSLWPLFSYFK